MPVQPHEFGIARQIGDLGKIRLVVLTCEYPPNMAIDEARMMGRVHILIRVGIPVVMPMLARPPYQALLRTRLRPEAENELNHSASRIRSVGEVPMISCNDTEHAQPIEGHTDCERLPADPRPNRHEAS